MSDKSFQCELLCKSLQSELVCCITNSLDKIAVAISVGHTLYKSTAFFPKQFVLPQTESHFTMDVIDANDTDGCMVVYLAEDVLLLSSIDKVFLSIITPVVVTFGAIFNLAFLFVLYRIEEMQTLTNFYLANLAAADLGTLLSLGGQYITLYINSPKFNVGWAFKEFWGCLLTGFSGYLFYFGSVFFLTIVVFDRYMAICFPLKYMVMKTKSYVARVTCILWIVSLCMASTSSRYTVSGIGCVQDVSSIIKINLCFSNKVSQELEITIGLLDLSQFLISFSTCIFMMTHIIYILSIRVNSSDSAGTKKVRNKIARMLIINAIIFFLCQVPFQIYNVDYLFYLITSKHIIKNNSTWNIIGWLGRVASLVNSSINPIVYNMTNDRYRKAFKAAFSFGRASDTGSISSVISNDLRVSSSTM